MQRARGFTLIELVISVAITTMLIALVSQIYQTVNRIGNHSIGINQDWGAMQFMRTQFDAVDIGLNTYFQAVKGEESIFSFISKNSAQFGKAKQPVLVSYRYNGASKELSYMEIPLPPWWGENRAEYYAAQIDNWRLYRDKFSYDNILLQDVDSAKFEYWDSFNKKWISSWTQKKLLPPLIRMQFTKLGTQQELVLAPGVLSLSSAYGY
jgi:prepilin-type N-terminal cleavage/methylation domain-containing protein